MGKDKPRDEKILHWDGITTLELPVERILETALDSDLDQVIVIGVEQDGEFYLSSSKTDCDKLLWLIEVAKKRLMENI